MVFFLFFHEIRFYHYLRRLPFRLPFFQPSPLQASILTAGRILGETHVYHQRAQIIFWQGFQFETQLQSSIQTALWPPPSRQWHLTTSKPCWHRRNTSSLLLMGSFINLLISSLIQSFTHYALPISMKTLKATTFSREWYQIERTKSGVGGCNSEFDN